MPGATIAEKSINGVPVRIVRGDITVLPCDAFVFYARPDLLLGSGFGTAIALRGGPSIQKELEGRGPLAVGEVAVSGAGNLAARHIIHAVGPRFQEEDTPAKLGRTVRSALRAAEETGVRHIAFPAMGSGFYGIPADVCARIMLAEFSAHLGGPSGIGEVTICAIDTREYTAFTKALAER